METQPAVPIGLTLGPMKAQHSAKGRLDGLCGCPELPRVPALLGSLCADAWHSPSVLGQIVKLPKCHHMSIQETPSQVAQGLCLANSEWASRQAIAFEGKVGWGLLCPKNAQAQSSETAEEAASVTLIVPML